MEQNSVKKEPQKLEIKEHLLSSLPIKELQSRISTAIMLSYYGGNLEVYFLMQHLSHSSRAYIHNSAGLKGFLKPQGFLAYFRHCEIHENTEAIRRYH